MFEDAQQPKPAAPPPRQPSRGDLAKLGEQAAEFEKPKNAAKPNEDDFVIQIMPEEYYGVAPKTPVKKKETIPSPKGPPPPPPPPKSARPLPPAAQPQPRRKIPIILVIGAVLLIVVAVGGFLLLRSLEESRPPAPSPPPVAAPPAAPPAPPPPAPPPPPPPAPIRPGIDTDSDGLTDSEETGIYGSDPQNPDSDADSFIDGNEVFHGYDPVRIAPAALEDAKSHIVLRDNDLALSVIVPRSWRFQKIGDNQLWSRLADSSIIRLERIPRQEPTEAGGSGIRELAARRYPDKQFVDYETGNGFSGLRSSDRRQVIVLIDSVFIVFQYELGGARTIEYLRTFEATVNSLMLL